MLTFTNPPSPPSPQPNNTPFPGGMSKPSEQKPLEYFLNFASRLTTINESEEARQRAQLIVQLCRRHRGMSSSDLFGYWRRDVWCESPMFDSLQSTNIFQSLIRGAEANYNQAPIKLDVKAKANNFQNRSVERIARGVYEILNESQWTETTEQQIFFAVILKLNAFLISRFDKSKGTNSLPVPEYDEINYEQGGTYICPECYESGDYGSDTTQCDNCGSETLSVMDAPEAHNTQLVSGFGMKPMGEAELIVADALDVSVNDSCANPADISSTSWVEWRYFAQKNELKRLYPHLKLDSPPKWCYQTRLKVALKRMERAESMPRTEFDKTNYEVRQIWLDLAEYEDYVSPIDYQCGEFRLKQGQKLAEVCPNGCVFGVVGQEIAFIDNEDKNKRVTSCLWLADGISFYGLGAKSGLPIQKKINQLDNMAMEGEARSLKGALVYDNQAIDGAHLEGANTNIPTRPDFSANDKPLSNFVLPLDVTGLSQSSLVYLASQADAMQKVMGVPDVTLGEDTSQDKTLGGQMLRDRNATGLLIPAKKSEGRAKELWLCHQLDLIKTYGSPEMLRQYGTRYGEEWLDDELEAFFATDLDQAITISYVEGSEIPESRYEKQMKLRQDIAAGFIPMTAELASKLAQQSGYDGLDIGFFESNRKLAEKRWTWVKEYIAEQNEQLTAAYNFYEQQLTDPSTGQRLTDETGNPVPNPIIQQFATAPELKINKQAEAHDQHFEYWAARVRDLTASSMETSPILVDICDMMMTRHNQAKFEIAVRNETLTGLSQMPSQVGGQMMSNAMNPPIDKNQNGKNESKPKNGSQNSKKT